MLFIFNILLIFTNKFSKRNGLDERYPIKDPNHKIDEIFININKMRLLNKLNNDHLNINDKINIIKKYNVLNDDFRPNILEGGLLDDWDFDID